MTEQEREMDKVTEYCSRIFNFYPEEKFESITHVLQTARKVYPLTVYMQSCVFIAERLAEYFDKQDKPND